MAVPFFVSLPGPSTAVRPAPANACGKACGGQRLTLGEDRGGCSSPACPQGPSAGSPQANARAHRRRTALVPSFHTTSATTSLEDLSLYEERRPCNCWQPIWGIV